MCFQSVPFIFLSSVYLYSHHQMNSHTQKEVWDGSAVGKEDKGYQDQ